MKPISGIYCIKNNINNKMYVGKSLDIHKRFGIHKRVLNNGSHVNKHLQNSWNKHGENNFSFYILEACSNSKLDFKEKHYIKELKTKHPSGYNLTDGGDGNNNMFFSRKRREKISKRMIGNTFRKGVLHTEEVKKKISDWGKERPKSKKHKEKISKAHKDKKKGNPSSKFLGVSVRKHLSKKIGWMSQINVKKRKIYLGIFKKEIDAAKAYDEYIIKNKLNNKTNFEIGKIKT